MKPFGRFIAFAVAIAALAAAFVFSAPAQAQDETYVDLSIEITVGTSFVFTAKNQGTAAAYDVTVDIEIADQTIHETGAGQFTRKSGATCSGNIPGTTCIRGVWTVGTLGVDEETGFTITPSLASGLPCCPNFSDGWAVPARAVIKSAAPEEEERFKGDNTAVVWIYVSQNRSTASATVGDYWLEAGVDDLLPDAGDTVKFSIKVNASTDSRNFIDDIKVRLKLDNGMGTPTASTPPTNTTFTQVGMTRTWDWEIDTYTAESLVVSTTLDNPLPDGVARSDLCLTAELTARPGNDLGSPDSVASTSAEICLREDPVVLLEEGEAILFNMYPCVGVTAYPCSSDDTLEVRAVARRSASRAAGIARDEAVLDPTRVFVQVKDPEGRRIDAHSSSVNSGTAPSWHTARDAQSSLGDGNTGVDGVRVSYTRREFTTEQRANYTRLDRTVAVAGLDGAAAPGLVKIRFSSGSAEFEPNPSDLTSGLNSYFAVSTGVFARFVEFSTLGTYKIDFTPAVTHTNSTVYSDTGSYIFHVGPVAELGVSDGGAGLAPSGTRAFTIVAVNSGPDDAPNVEVEVTGLNDGDYVSHSETAGRFDSGTGVWTIRELKNSDFYQDIYGRDGEVLTIFTSAAVDTEITAAISNDQDYEVCIDSDGDDVDAGNQADCKTEAGNTNVWYAEVCVRDSDRGNVRCCGNRDA